MLTAWDETGATYDCSPSDNDLFNPAPDCDDTWSGGNYEDYSSDSLLQQNSAGNWENFDVTADLQLLQNGHDNYGWIIRKRNFADDGTVDFTSIQGNPVYRPRLIVVANDQPCVPTSFDSVSPGSIIADGSVTTVTVTGQGLENVTSVLRDGTSIPFTSSPNILTFNQSDTIVQSHLVQFKSNCVADPLPLYTIEAVQSGTESPEASIACDSPGAVTKFSRGALSTEPGVKKYLCAGTTGSMKTVKLIGNGLPLLAAADVAYRDNSSTAPTCMNQNA
jgi:hypothetical protein